VIFINGWTDGPNAIATCVTTRCLKPKTRFFCGGLQRPRHLLIGVVGAYLTDFGSVAKTIASLVNFDTSTEPG
jgi:PiT family inorganic phosphate transporter